MPYPHVPASAVASTRGPAPDRTALRRSAACAQAWPPTSTPSSAFLPQENVQFAEPQGAREVATARAAPVVASPAHQSHLLPIPPADPTPPDAASARSASHPM